MAETTIAQMPEASSVITSDFLVVQQAGGTKKASVGVLQSSIVTSSGSATPYNVGNITGTVTLNANNGGIQKAGVTGNITLNAPSNGVAGSRLELWLTPSGTNKTLTLHSAILKPSDSGIAFPKTMTVNKMYVVLFKHNGTAWMLLSLIGGY